jgi:hypothetical protein
MLLTVLQGFFVSVFSWLQKTETTTAKILFSSLITAFSLTLLNDLLLKFGVFHHHPKWLFLPIFFTYSFGPLLFFYVKASLYNAFRLHWKDIKHFMLPLAQIFFFCAMFFDAPEVKLHHWQNDFSIFYGTFAYPIYLLSFTIYAYFAYRFIKHKIVAMHQLKVTTEKEWRKVHRLRQVLKGWYILLLINSSFIIFNFITEYLFHYSLNTNKLYLFFNEMSMVAMSVWLAAYGYYKVAKGLGVIDFLKKKILRRRS